MYDDGETAIYAYHIQNLRGFSGVEGVDYGSCMEACVKLRINQNLSFIFRHEHVPAKLRQTTERQQHICYASIALDLETFVNLSLNLSDITFHLASVSDS